MKAQRDRGFTLVELMVTVALIAFLGLILSKTFNSSAWLAHYRLKGAARDLAINLQKARMNAIKENRAWAVAFDTGAGTYSLVSSGVDMSISATADNIVAETVSLSAYKNGIQYGRAGVGSSPLGGTIGNDVTFTSAMVTFSSKGLADGSGYCYLTNDQGAVFAIGALLSGVVKVMEWTGSRWK